MLPNSKSNNLAEELKKTQNTNSSTDESIYVGHLSGTHSGGFDISSKNLTSQSLDIPKSNDDIFDIIPNVKEYLDKNDNQGQAKQLNTLLDLFRRILTGYDIDLPKIRISLADDNSITVSWRVGKAYFGASIFADENESSWSLVAGGARSYAADGYLNDPYLEVPLQNSVNFLIRQQIQKG